VVVVVDGGRVVVVVDGGCVVVVVLDEGRVVVLPMAPESWYWPYRGHGRDRGRYLRSTRRGRRTLLSRGHRRTRVRRRDVRARHAAGLSARSARRRLQTLARRWPMRSNSLSSSHSSLMTERAPPMSVREPRDGEGLVHPSMLHNVSTEHWDSAHVSDFVLH